MVHVQCSDQVRWTNPLAEDADETSFDPTAVTFEAGESSNFDDEGQDRVAQATYVPSLALSVPTLCSADLDRLASRETETLRQNAR